jgi:hypothetical protein
MSPAAPDDDGPSLAAVEASLAMGTIFQPKLADLARATIEEGLHSGYDGAAIMQAIAVECLLLAAYMAPDRQTTRSLLSQFQIAIAAAQQSRAERAAREAN